MLANRDRDATMIGVELTKKLKLVDAFDTLQSLTIDRHADEDLRCQAAEACAVTASERAVGPLHGAVERCR